MTLKNLFVISSFDCADYMTFISLAEHHFDFVVDVCLLICQEQVYAST